ELEAQPEGPRRRVARPRVVDDAGEVLARLVDGPAGLDDLLRLKSRQVHDIRRDLSADLVLDLARAEARQPEAGAGRGDRAVDGRDRAARAGPDDHEAGLEGGLDRLDAPE